MARTRIAEFGLIQKLLAYATVAVYVADTNGESTGVLATLYQESTGPESRSNPQTLDENGKLTVDCWVEDYVMAEISNITETAERSIRKIRANPVQYPLPVTSASVNTADVDAAAAAAAASAATATTQAGIATTQASNASTSASTATTQAATATTQAGIATTQAGNAATSAAAALVSQNAAEAASNGMKWRTPVEARTTGALPACTYSNGSSGVGATLTANANGALSAQDGITLVANDRLAVFDQASTQHNGIYVVTQVGSGGTPWILTRATDADTWDELVGQVVTVKGGTLWADYTFICTIDSGGTIGTTSITWSTFKVVLPDGSVTLLKLASSVQTSLVNADTALQPGQATTITLDTIKATTSGTTVDFTSIPSGVKRVTVNFSGVSTNGTDAILVQLGDSGGVENTGYLGGCTTATTATATTNYTAGIGITIAAGTNVIHGSIVFALIDSATNLWAASGVLASSDSARSYYTAGSKALSDTLDRLRITTSGGTNTFDAGSINISYE